MSTRATRLVPPVGMNPPVRLNHPDDPRCVRVHRPPRQFDVPYVPTAPHIVEAMLDLAQVREEDVVYDLGCGDGRICIAAARRGARAVGVDADIQRVREAYWNARRACVGHRCHFEKASFHDVDIRPATVVTLYLLTSTNLRLRPKLLFELRPGSRIVANYFDIGRWQPDESIRVDQRDLYKWIVPAWVQGQWRCFLADPRPPRKGRNCRPRHLMLHLSRRFQRISGYARIGDAIRPLIGGHLRGSKVSFALPDGSLTAPLLQFRAMYDGRLLRGTCQCPTGEVFQWSAVRANA